MRPALRAYRTWTVDSRRWNAWRPRSDDIVIAAYAKSGTTWMQQIVALLVFDDTAPRPLMDISVWLDRRFGEELDAALARLDAQTHRRFLKTHLPADGLPIHEDVRYIHVARDGRDAALSFHNHAMGYSPEMQEMLDRLGRADPEIGRPYPRTPADPSDHFHHWITNGAVPGHTDGSPGPSWFDCERTWWAERGRQNVLFVHYEDLRRDLSGEMRRIATFLGMSIPAERWPELVAAAGFEAMRRNGDQLLGRMAQAFRGAGERFFHRGQSGRWRGTFRPEDLARFDTKLASLPGGCSRWAIEGGPLPA